MGIYIYCIFSNLYINLFSSSRLQKIDFCTLCFNDEIELKLLKLEMIEKENVVDTLEIARSKYPGSSNSLDSLCKRFNIDLTFLEKLECNTFRWGGEYLNNMDYRSTLFTELGVFEHFLVFYLFFV